MQQSKISTFFGKKPYAEKKDSTKKKPENLEKTVKKKQRIMESSDEDDFQETVKVSAKVENNKTTIPPAITPSSLLSNIEIKRSDRTSTGKNMDLKQKPTKTDAAEEIIIGDGDVEMQTIQEPKKEKIKQNHISTLKKPVEIQNNLEQIDTNTSVAKKEKKKRVLPQFELKEEKKKSPLKRAPTDEAIEVDSSETTMEMNKKIKVSNKSSEDLEGKKEEGSDAKKRNYMAFLARQKDKTGPVALGSKEIPEGKENCLLGLTFVFTGDLSSITREDAQDLARKYGGRVTTAPSNKTSFLVVGDNPGESKLKKADSIGLKKIDEDAFLDLIRNSETKTEVSASTSTSKKKGSTPAKKKSTKSEESFSKSNTPSTTPTPTRKSSDLKPEVLATAIKFSDFKHEPSKSMKEKNCLKVEKKNDTSSTLWTEKFRPKTYSEIIGNKAIVDKLSNWLKSWDKNLKTGFSKSKEDFSHFRAVLLSGPPGIGKTTMAHLVAKVEGWDPIEFNASDTRSKKAIDNMVSELTGSHNLMEYYSNKNSNSLDTHKKQVIIMDEVDGMSAGDRGGTAQLILLIKKTKVPIICICNDRQSTKVKSLVNHCLDLKLRKIMENQLQARIASIAKSEGLELKPGTIHELVAGTQADIRQILNLLSTFRRTKNILSFEDSKSLMKLSEKNQNLTPFSALSALMDVKAAQTKSINEKLELFFQDFSLMPLMVHENYMKSTLPLAKSVVKDNSKNRLVIEELALLSNAADSISDGDLIDTTLRRAQHWSLLPVYGIMSTVRPNFFCHGSITGGFPSFPGWLGQNSKANKSHRQLKELEAKLKLKISGDKSEVRQSYLPCLNTLLVNPLINSGKDAVDDVIKMMDEYYLTKEDFDNLLDLGIGFQEKDKVWTKLIPSSVKSSFTSAYNKSSHPVQIFLTAESKNFKPTKKKADTIEDVFGELEEEDNFVEEEIEEVDEIKVDKLIKEKSKKNAVSSSSKKSSGRKGKK